MSIVIAVVFVSAFFMWRVEYDAPGATITTYGNAIWWAIVTTTTVGYGDYTPVTQVGRGIAILVMMVGIGLIGTVSATVAAWFVTRPSEGEQPSTSASPEVLADLALADGSQSELIARMDSLAAQQEEFRVMLLQLNSPSGGLAPDPS